MTEILVYGDQDLNLVDGSSVWLASTLEVLSNLSGTRVRILTKTPRERSLLIGSLLERPNVRFIDPWAVQEPKPAWRAILDRLPHPRLSSDAAAALIALLDDEEPADILLVRAPDTARQLGRDEHRGARLWSYLCAPGPNEGVSKTTREIFDRSALVLCQTEELRDLFLKRHSGRAQVALLPPMVRDWNHPSVEPPSREQGQARLCYSGKFSPGYRIDEQLDAFGQIRGTLPHAEFHIFGDKFHNHPPTRSYVEGLTKRLTTTSGVVWHGALARHEVNSHLAECHVACSWRASEFDDSVELSTKILEYGNLGLPVLLNPTAIQRRVFGSDYPCFVDSSESFAKTFIDLVSSASFFREVGERVRHVTKAYTFSKASERVAELIEKHGPRSAISVRSRDVERKRPRVVIAGHDLKFTTEVQQYFSTNAWEELRTDVWRGHTQHDEAASRELAEWADVVWCEWCLGNAVWYSNWFSKNKRPGQRLIIRLHNQEMTLPLLKKVKWEAVDHLIAISPQHADSLRAMAPEISSRTTMIFNLIDCEALDAPKMPFSDFNIGFLGLVPRRKRPDLALDILERLRKSDSRWSLHIKGKLPWEYDWCWRRPEERAYYGELFERMSQIGGITLDGFSSDMAGWYSRLGFLASTSDFEGSHQAVAEAMATGSIPIIRNWTGASELYPKRYVYRDTEDAVRLIESLHQPKIYDAEALAAKDFARQNFDKTKVWEQLDLLFSQAPS